ncbi:helix-turn-helix domain-containing protein [Ulvibacterium marinum]|uniref:helix-turn-helix domain-containing protein n=1 Tax=Ulvibacterium marinum TaxID=2419782 RepID=UPI0024941F7A|nr:AraC family transcriptional regulator [Ulvibacterium marinum]
MDLVVIKEVSLLMNAVGVGNCFLLSFSYLKKKEDRTLANPILSLLFFILGSVILNTIFNFMGYSDSLYGFEPITNALIFGIAPLLFLYVRGLGKEAHFTKLWSVHLIHFYCYLAITIISIVLPHSSFGQWGRSLTESKWMIFLWNFHFLVYLIVIFLKFRKEDINFPWTSKLLVYGIASIWFLNLLFFLYRFYVQPLHNLFYLNITLLFSVMTLYLFYQKLGVEVIPKSNYRGRKLNKTQMPNGGTDVLVATIREQKYYKDPELDIRALSELVQMPYHELSFKINQEYHQNFNTFINSFRVQEVVQALENQQHKSYTIMGLAKQAGFKSASVFYAAFKKEKGSTPTDFLKDII